MPSGSNRPADRAGRPARPARRPGRGPSVSASRDGWRESRTGWSPAPRSPGACAGPARAALGPADRVTLARATLVGGVAALTVDSFARPAPVARAGRAGHRGARASTRSTAGSPGAPAPPPRSVPASTWRSTRSSSWCSACTSRARSAGGCSRSARCGTRTSRPAGCCPGCAGRCRRATGGRSSRRPRASSSWSRRPGVLPRPLSSAVLAVALALLVESFGRDVGWLWHRRPVESAAAAGSRRGALRGRSATVRAAAATARRRHDPVAPAAPATAAATLVRACACRLGGGR